MNLPTRVTLTLFMQDPATAFCMQEQLGMTEHPVIDVISNVGETDRISVS